VGKEDGLGVEEGERVEGGKEISGRVGVVWKAILCYSILMASTADPRVKTPKPHCVTFCATNRSEKTGIDRINRNR